MDTAPQTYVPGFPSWFGSPEANRARIDAAKQARKIRRESLLAARRVRTKYGIRTVAELNAEIQNLLTAFECGPSEYGYEFKEQLAALAMALDDECNPARSEA